MKLGIMFFPSVDETPAAAKYALVIRAATFADREGFECVWTPERHFHAFGGLFPNPLVMSAALATVTTRIQLRAGSLIVPLHNEIRVAEDLALVDNLSDGRVGVSFGSGWNVDDFVLAPANYPQRRALMFEQIESIQRLWRGEAFSRANSAGRPVEIQIAPRPIQPSLPVWVTSSGNPSTFADAGRRGFNVLTHLVGKDLAALADRIALYRESWSGPPSTRGIVTVMLHTFLGADDRLVKRTARPALTAYLRSALALEQRAAAGGGAVSGGRTVHHDEISNPRDHDSVIELACERYLNGGSLIGTPASCRHVLGQLAEIGVDEAACLLDFGLSDVDVMESLQYLADLRRSLDPQDETATASADLVRAFADDLDVLQ
jgi:natural product biosynthesis luciferase-like monooxygenase protein